MDTNVSRNKRVQIFTVVFLIVFFIIDIAYVYNDYVGAMEAFDRGNKLDVAFGWVITVILFIPLLIQQLLFLLSGRLVIKDELNKHSKGFALAVIVVSALNILIYFFESINITLFDDEIIHYIIIPFASLPLSIMFYIATKLLSRRKAAS